ncbi:MAG: hypothetical protein Q8N02_05395 [Methylotenera sp.]|nr:hypothetical protein [Methylotenera sp.]MDP2100913.1 hypothetical protein [Methylotenera sp.]MDP2403849.1 hypothetical protein [Methylotenera sp.]MDP3095000.1 hypothetical protein [Methylotenera sp.]MDP3206326.1 hypothetical protein [Methylotenera sp.]
MSDLVSDPLFGRLIGQQIGNNAHAEADRIRAETALDSEKQMSGNAVLVVGLLKSQMDTLASNEASLDVAIAGVRGVTREILNELRRADPNNPMLDKKLRDAVFDVNFQDQVVRQKNTGWKDRAGKQQEYRDAAYGAEGANKGGPEKSKITPNKAVRKAAGVPEDHIPDRERFIALIGRLANELKAHDPNASILTEVIKYVQ